MDSVEEIGKRILNDKVSKHLTALPFFQIMEAVRIDGIEEEYADGVAWVDDGEDADPDYAAELEKRYQDGDGDYNYHDRTCYINQTKFLTGFFTKEGADDFIEKNQHRYKKLTVLIESFHRNHEMIAVRAHLMELGKGGCDE